MYSWEFIILSLVCVAESGEKELFYSIRAHKFYEKGRKSECRLENFCSGYLHINSLLMDGSTFRRIGCSALEAASHMGWMLQKISSTNLLCKQFSFGMQILDPMCQHQQQNNLSYGSITFPKAEIEKGEM